MTTHFPRLGTLLACTLLAPALGCDTELSDPEQVALLEEIDQAPTPERLAADALYMRELYQEYRGSGAMPIDLGDDVQYRFMVGRLRAAGLSSLTSPELFDRIEGARMRAVDGVVARAGNDRCDMFITPTDAPAGTLDTLGRASCVDGSDYSMLQTCHYDEVGALLDCGLQEEFAGGITTDVETASITDEGFADGVSYHLGHGGEEFYYRATPMMATMGGLQIGMAAPQDQTGNGSVLLCQERSTNSSDCDYKHTNSGACGGNSVCDNASNPLFPVWNADGSGQYNNSRLYMPLQSASTPTISLPSGAVINSARAWMTLVGQGDSSPPGGLCTGDFTNATDYLRLLPHPQIPNWKELVIDPFALDMGNAVWPDHCVDNRTDVDLHVEINVQTGVSSRTYSWNSSTDYDYLEVAWGCLPPGTIITLDGGAEVTIEDVELGDRVVADDDGGMLTVVDIMEGHEEEPLVVIEDSLGHVVSMTANHPVPVTGEGVLEARELEVGDRLETEDGVAFVVDVELEDYEGEVYNLILGTPEELRTRGENTTMIANRVVVGDARMQQALGIERSEQARATRDQAPVPPELYMDYVGSHIRALVRQLQG